MTDLNKALTHEEAKELRESLKLFIRPSREMIDKLPSRENPEERKAAITALQEDLDEALCHICIDATESLSELGWEVREV